MFNVIVVHIMDSLLKRPQRWKETPPFYKAQQTQPVNITSRFSNDNLSSRKRTRWIQLVILNSAGMWTGCLLANCPRPQERRILIFLWRWHCNLEPNLEVKLLTLPRVWVKGGVASWYLHCKQKVPPSLRKTFLDRKTDKRLVQLLKKDSYTREKDPEKIYKFSKVNALRERSRDVSLSLFDCQEEMVLFVFALQRAFGLF